MSQPYKVGFANLSEVEEYAVIVRESLEALTAQDVEIELIVRNNDHDDEKALANAREFAEMGVDLVIMYHINERLGPKFRSILKTIPIVCVDIPIPFTAYVGIDNSQMGAMAAEALLSWVHQGWGSIDKVLAVLDSRVLDVVRDRIMQVTTRLEKEAVIAKGNILFLDARFSQEETYRLAYQALQGWEEFNKIAVVAYNDQTALNALKVVQDLHLEDKVVIVGHAASDIVIEKIKSQTPLIASTLSYPEKYGEILLDVAKHIVRGDRVPPRNYVPLGLLKSPVIA